MDFFFKIGTNNICGKMKVKFDIGRNPSTAPPPPPQNMRFFLQFGGFRSITPELIWTLAHTLYVLKWRSSSILGVVRLQTVRQRGIKCIYFPENFMYPRGYIYVFTQVFFFFLPPFWFPNDNLRTVGWIIFKIGTNVICGKRKVKFNVGHDPRTAPPQPTQNVRFFVQFGGFDTITQELIEVSISTLAHTL